MTVTLSSASRYLLVEWYIDPFGWMRSSTSRCSVKGILTKSKLSGLDVWGIIVARTPGTDRAFRGGASAGHGSSHQAHQGSRTTWTRTLGKPTPNGERLTAFGAGAVSESAAGNFTREEQK